MLNYAAPPNPAAPTVGQGVAQTAADVAQALPSWPSVEEQRRMLQPLSGWQGTAVDAAKQWAEGVMMGTTAPGDVPPPGIVAYHGSPHSFDQFDTSKIGTGEGAQAYGHGLYLAENEGTAGQYRSLLSQAPRVYGKLVGEADGAPHGYLYRANGDVDEAIKAAQTDLSQAQSSGAKIDQFRAQGAQSALDQLNAWKADNAVTPPGGHMYQVSIGADPEHFLDWDKPLSEQHPVVQQALNNTPYPPHDMSMSVRQHMAELETNREGTTRTGDPAALAAQALRDAGIPGIRYLDQGSRGAGQGSHNYVVFDANTIQVLKKYGLAGLMLGAGGVASQQSGNGQ
jgi:hypothetical protein